MPRNTGVFRRLRKNAVPSKNLPKSKADHSPTNEQKEQQQKRQDRSAKRNLLRIFREENQKSVDSTCVSNFLLNCIAKYVCKRTDANDLMHCVSFTAVMVIGTSNLRMRL